MCMIRPNSELMNQNLQGLYDLCQRKSSKHLIYLSCLWKILKIILYLYQWCWRKVIVWHSFPVQVRVPLAIPYHPAILLKRKRPLSVSMNRSLPATLGHLSELLVEVLLIRKVVVLIFCKVKLEDVYSCKPAQTRFPPEIHVCHT